LRRHVSTYPLHKTDHHEEHEGHEGILGKPNTAFTASLLHGEVCCHKYTVKE
jgi:hypothetical protein